MRGGFTLVELLLVIVIAGSLMIIGLPTVKSFRDRVQVAAAASSMIIAIERARDESSARGLPVEVTFAADSLRIIADPGRTGLAVWATGGPSSSGVGLTGPSTAIRLAPSGLPVGPVNGTWVLRRGSVQRRLVVSRYGRVRILP